MTVLIGMFLLGLFIALGTWVVSWSNHVKSELMVKVYFDDTAGAKQLERDRELVLAGGRVQRVDFVSKQKALEIMAKKYPDLTKDLAYNPLPNTLEVTPKHAEDTGAIAQTITKRNLAGRRQDQVRPEDRAPDPQRREGDRVDLPVAVVVLLGASTLLIANTIRLSIFSRRREIEVMKLVGATNWFVRGPFMLEGLLCGLMGSLAAVILLVVGKEIALPAILGQVDSGSDAQALAFPLTALILLATGLLLGAAGSGLTIRRFLKV